MRDIEIVASIVAGDPKGLAIAYDRYADPLFRYCGTLLSDPAGAAGAAGAVQDTLVIAASRLDRLREPERLRAWLYAVARNECLRTGRAKKGAPALDKAPDVTGSGDVTARAQRAGLRALFEDAAAGLDPGEREVTELHRRQGLDTSEVAAVLGVSRNQAHALVSRATDQLEDCLGALLVGRAGRGECGELGAVLAGWDGRLTVRLRERVHRHLEHCPACTARRALELRPARLLGLSPGAAMAVGAAESLRRAFGAPPGLRARAIGLAAGHSPGAAAHRAAVLARAGTFGKQGFPGLAPAGMAGAAVRRGAGRVRALRSSPRGQAALVATVAAAVAIAAMAFTLAGGNEHLAPSADPGPPRSVGPPPGPAAGALSVLPDGGTTLVVPGVTGTLVSLRGAGGTVTWSASVASDPGHVVSVSPAAGTLTAADPAATLTITTSQFVRCGPGVATRCPTVTVSPGGAVFAVWTGWPLPFPPGSAPSATPSRHITIR
jgi:RNA polymerase sigma factor (sigma-70 family)